LHFGCSLFLSNEQSISSSSELHSGRSLFTSKLQSGAHSGNFLFSGLEQSGILFMIVGVGFVTLVVAVFVDTLVVEV